MRPARETAFGAIPAYCRYELFMARYYHISRVIERRLKDRHERSKLLDVGAGEGYLKYFCKDLDIDWTGIENHPYRAQVCRDLGYRVFEKDVESDRLPFGAGEFEIVVLSHVIEHLQSPENLIVRAREWLSPDGLLILGVPMHTRAARAFRMAIGPVWETLVGRKKSHKHFFTMPRLLELLDGWKVDEVRGFRFISTRKYLPLENSEHFFRLNYELGQRFPEWTPEVNVVARPV